MSKSMLIFLKAEQLGLFDQMVPVKGHMREGVFVAPSMAIRKKKLPEAKGENDLSNPETYANNPELATLARRAAEESWKPGEMSRGDFKREVLAGKHPEVVRAALEKRDQEQKEAAEAALKREQKEKKAAEAAKKASEKAAQELVSEQLPAGYAIAAEGDKLIVSGPFDEDLHERIKRAGGRWDGTMGTNRRVWIVPESKGASLKRAIANWAKANEDRLAKEAEARRKQEAETAQARMSAPEVAPGQYGPFSVKQSARDPNKYVVSFKYDPDLISKVKEAKSARFDRQFKVWMVDKADAAKLKDILERGKEIADKKSAADEKARQVEAERRSAAAAADAEERKRKGLSTAYYWAERSGDGVPYIGDTVKRGGEYHVVTDVSRGRYFEDAMSFGGTDDRPYQFRVELRRATEEEANAAKAREKSTEDRRQAKRDLADVAREIARHGEVPESATPEGDVVVDTFNIYGGGERIIIGDDKIWYVQNNGADGDDWSRNNVRTGGAGAIGWYVPKTPDLERRIRDAVRKSI